MGTLSTLGARFVAERERRGELTRQSAKNRRYTYRTLDRTFGGRPLDQFTKRAVERWLETIGHLSPATRRQHLSNVRVLCRWMVDQGLIPADPCEKIPKIRQPRSVPRALSIADVRRLILVCPDQRARTIAMLMVGCGLRCVEVSRLDIQDYDPHGQSLTIVGKGGHQRLLPVPAEVVEHLDRWLSEIGTVAGPLIPSRISPSRSLSADTISGYMSQWMSDAGIKTRARDGRSAHALRHTAASDVLDRCGDLRVVQEMLGHQHLATTAIYLRRKTLGQLRDAMEGRDYTRGPLPASGPRAA